MRSGAWLRGGVLAQQLVEQPHNLSKGCKLKDYQLEGLRWLYTLYENGLSGILADGATSSRFPSRESLPLHSSRRARASDSVSPLP